MPMQCKIISRAIEITIDNSIKEEEEEEAKTKGGIMPLVSIMENWFIMH